MAGDTPRLEFVLKVVSKCNLNCSYCYVYNKGDSTWRTRPSIMPDAVFDAALKRIREHCLQSGQRTAHVTFHGGEPCLAGPQRFAQWCCKLKEALSDTARVELTLQTNGTLLDDLWAEVFAEHRINVGISIDGAPDQHDLFRVDHQGRGSYKDVERGIGVLQKAGIPLQILSVIQLGADGLRAHRHFVELGAATINYLLPDFTHDTIEPVRQQYGRTPCADYLLPIFEDWWRNGTLDLKIGIFWDMARLILGGDSEVDLLGNKPFRYMFVEADGAIEGLDVLRICQEGMTNTGLNVTRNAFIEVADISGIHRAAIFDGLPLPTNCGGCPESQTCGGGYLPHRFSQARGFDNPSVWCADLLRLFAHVRHRLEVSPGETLLRRERLSHAH